MQSAVFPAGYQPNIASAEYRPKRIRLAESQPKKSVSRSLGKKFRLWGLPTINFSTPCLSPKSFKGPIFESSTSKSGRKRREKGRTPKRSMPRALELFALPLLVQGKAGGPQTLVCGGHNFKLRHCLKPLL